MARALRIQQPGAWYHVTARGNERKDIFRDDPDRLHFRALLGEMVERCGLLLHSWVLMSNHYHLLLEAPRGNLSLAMQWLNVSYSVWFNRRHRRIGHLFQGRFKAIVVEAQSWALALSRYVHLNPVRTVHFRLDKKARQRQRMGVVEMPTAEQVQQRPLVAQTSNLLYRRLPVGRASYCLRFGVFARPADWKSNDTH